MCRSFRSLRARIGAVVAVGVQLVLLGSGRATVSAQNDVAAAASARSHWLERLDRLARPDGRHGTFGPTGPRLWATELGAAPGLAGRAHWLHPAPALGPLHDPLVVEFVPPGGGAGLPVEVSSRRWFPTHAETSFRIGGETDGFRVDEHEWIETDADVWASRLVVHGPARFVVRWSSSELAEAPADGVDRFHAIRIDRFANTNVRTDARLLLDGSLDEPIAIVAEAHAFQLGSDGPLRRGDAIGGAALGSGWGRDAGHRAGWEMVGAGAERPLRAWFRYARAGATAARFVVRADGNDVGELLLEPTARDGTRAAPFAWAAIDLGALPPRPLVLELVAAAAGSAVTLDTLVVASPRVGTAGGGEPPDVRTWAGRDPLRGTIDVDNLTRAEGGVPWIDVRSARVHGVDPSGAPLVVDGAGALLHVRAVPIGPRPTLRCGDRVLRLAPRDRSGGYRQATLRVPPDGDVELDWVDVVVLAVSRERVDGEAAASNRRAGRPRLAGVEVERPLAARAMVVGAEPGQVVELAAGQRLELRLGIELTAGIAAPGRALRELLGAVADPLAAHRQRYAAWFARFAPRFTCADEVLETLWAYRWFLVRHHLVRPKLGHLRAPVFYGSRHDPRGARVVAAQTPHVVAETRWLAAPEFALGNVRAIVANQQADGAFADVRADRLEPAGSQWIGRATVDAFDVHPDDAALRTLLPSLAKNVIATAERADVDRRGLLKGTAVDRRQRRASAIAAGTSDLARPDVAAYRFANARALAGVATRLDDAELGERLTELAGRVRRAALDVLWNDEDAFFYSFDGSERASIRVQEIDGFAPFRFGLVPLEPRYLAAFGALFDESVFWTRYPLPSCSLDAAAFAGDAAADDPGAWNGPAWPASVGLVADALAVVLRDRRARDPAVTPERLAQLLRRYARSHFEASESRAAPLLRACRHPVTGAGYGPPDAFASTFADLVIRHLAGLQPRVGDDLVVRPLPLGWVGSFALEDVPYHGRRVTIRVDGDELRVAVDGQDLGIGRASTGLFLGGALR